MRPPQPLEVGPFGPEDGLANLGDHQQATYLRRYLEDLGTATVVREPYYFDRDYLAEFAAFYCVSVTGYPNVCQRLHFFGDRFDRSVLELALADDPAALHRLRDSYFGFIVVRPIPGAPLGRTVLGWYPDRQTTTTPRITTPSRNYDCHFAGMTLTVQGLAWQQQDAAVGTCATIALWSMLHSSALDGQHGLPTTASVTRSAHRTTPSGMRVFPNAGLNIQQLCEAIKEHGLSPIVVPGDVERTGSRRFSRERFAASCAAMLRSGFPVLVLGELNGSGHATCAVGFRAAAPPIAATGTVVHHDADVPFLYVHDDNLGPSVRFAIAVDGDGDVTLTPDAPPRVAVTPTPDPTLRYPTLVPGHLVIAVPEDLRTSPDALHIAGLDIATKLIAVLEASARQTGHQLPGLSMSTRFSRLRDYLGRDLAQVLAADRTLLGKVRLELTEKVPPMSLHLGVVRIGDHAVPLVDVLYDTTDNDAHLPVFAYVVFMASLQPVLSMMISHDVLPRAGCVDAW